MLFQLGARHMSHMVSGLGRHQTVPDFRRTVEQAEKEVPVSNEFSTGTYHCQIQNRRSWVKVRRLPFFGSWLTHRQPRCHFHRDAFPIHRWKGDGEAERTKERFQNLYIVRAPIELQLKPLQQGGIQGLFKEGSASPRDSTFEGGLMR